MSIHQEVANAREAALRDTIADLQRENAALRNEVNEQARLNGKGSEREAALLAKVETLQRENAAFRADKERLDWLAQLPDKRLSRVHYLWVNDGDIADMRAALDAARKEQP